MTSRDDESLGEFTQFEKYHIKPLSNTEAYKLIKKYDENNLEHIADDLINDIEKNDNYDILKEFLSNPLMVSLLYLTYQYKGVIPYKKHIFYRQVYDALFEKHDRIKGVGAIHNKKTGLDIEDFKKILSAMGFFSIKKGIVEFDKEEIRDLINTSISIYPTLAETNGKLFLDDILHAVPLFVVEGIKFKWAHKSFAEYFAAEFICNEIKDREEKIIDDMLSSLNSSKYYNVLEFIFDMDNSGATKYIIYPAIKNFVQTYPVKFSDERFSKYPKEVLDILKFYSWIEETYFVKIDKMKSSGKNRTADIEDYVEAFKLYKLAGKHAFSSAMLKSYADATFQLISFGKYYQAIKLIQRKEIDVFKKVKVQDYQMKVYKQLNVGTHFFDDTNGNILNEDNNAKAIASSIFHDNYDFRNMILDYDKCCRYLDKLEEERKKISRDIFSLD